MILSSNTKPDDKSHAHETSDIINVRDNASPITSTDVFISKSNIPSINRILVTHEFVFFSKLYNIMVDILIQIV